MMRCCRKSALSGTDSGSDTEWETESPSNLNMSRKLALAARYIIKFNLAWAKDFPLIASVRGDYYSTVGIELLTNQ